MFRLLLNEETCLEVSQFVFNDGSVQVQIEGEVPPAVGVVVIDAILQTPADQMGLIMVANAVREVAPMADVHLSMCFTPYGRQDASFCPGQANAMKAWAGVVNSLNFTTVTTLDPHSIAISHIDRCYAVDIVDVLRASKEMTEVFRDNIALTLVSPDAGANKKSHKICQTFGIDKLIRADKARDLQTGDILETVVYGDVCEDTCLIVDDLADGGATFVFLAEKLKEMGAKKIILFVTHGIFSKGLGVFEGLIDEIYTTTSWPQSTDITEGYTGKFTICGYAGEE